MSLTVGTNSYATVAEADAYFAERGNADWAALTTPAKESALILGCDYLEATYSQSWQGRRVDPLQALSWPRVDVFIDYLPVPSDSVPVVIVRANIEMALRAAAGEPLIADQGQQVVKEKVDVIEVQYQAHGDPAMRYPYVNRLLMPYLRSGAGDGTFQQVGLVRR